MQGYLAELRAKRREEARPLLAAKRRMAEHHREQRTKLADVQSNRRDKEAEVLKARLRRGVLGLWDRLTGKRAKTLARNETEAQTSIGRDRQERDQLKAEQFAQRRTLQDKVIAVRDRHQLEELEIRAEISRLATMKAAPDASLTERFNRTPSKSRQHTNLPRKPRGLDYEM